MKIHPLSDIHLEFTYHKYEYNLPDADVYVFAGDIAVGVMAIDWIENISGLKNKDIIYLTGNHEYYHNDFKTLDDAIRNKIVVHQEMGKTGNRIHFLQDDTVWINGVRFIGSTLWTDCNNLDPTTMTVVENSLNDFRLIQNFDVMEMCRQHAMSRNFLVKELTNNDVSPTVVVTHHSPTRMNVTRKSDIIQWAFHNSGMENLINFHGPDIWIYGHSHESVDFKLGKTHIISNQLGYPHEGDTYNKLFDPDKVLLL